jgi:aspartyl-tRNA(Asn)/glutamyl-tRNA(Gln) amidotransferase subunit B
LHAHGETIADSPVTPLWLARLVGLVEGGRLTGTNAKRALARCREQRRDPLEIAAEGLAQVDDDAAIEAAIAAVLAENPRQLALYRGGKRALRAYFAGLGIRATGGRADPRRVQELLARALETP